MSKLQDYDLRKLGQQSVDSFEDIQAIINYGKIAFPITTVVPTWTADNGEMAFYDGASTGSLPVRRIYVRLSSSWELFAASPGGGFPSPPEGAIQYNSSGTFGANAAFRYTVANSSLVIDDPITGISSLVVGTKGNISIYSGNFAGSPQGVISIGNGNAPSSTNDSTQLSSKNRSGVSRSGLLITAGFSTQHFLGDMPMFNNAGITPTALHSIYVASGVLVSGACVAGFDGNSTHDSPSQIALEMDGNNVSAINFNKNNAANPLGAYGAFSELELAYNRKDTRGYVAFTNANTNSQSTSGEDPLAAFLPQTLSILSGQSIVLQRHIAIFPATYTSLSNATVGTAATLYVHGGPIAAGSTTITQGYAIWVSGGTVRIDGSLITGGATTQTKGNVFFTTTAIGVSSNNAADTTLIRGVVGTTSLVANTLSEGRTIRLQAFGYYNTPLVADNLTMNVKLDGTTVLTTGAQTPASSVSTGGWHLNALITCLTTGGAGTVMSQGEFPHQSTAILEVNWQMVNSSNVTINTTGANVVEITAQWGGASSASQIFLTNAVGELLN